jgi:hypothetical protein
MSRKPKWAMFKRKRPHLPDKTLKLIIELREQESFTFKKIATYLNRHKHLTPYNRPWRGFTVRYHYEKGLTQRGIER